MNGNSDDARSGEAVVVGLGAAGAATLVQLALRGIRAIGIDRFHPPHDRGSSHGETRITRCAVGEGPAYVPLALRSQEIWREIEDRTGRQLFEASGCLVLASGDAAGIHHGRPGFLDQTIAMARRFGIAHEQLSAAEIEYRYPQFLCRQAERACFEPGGGFLFPEACIAAQLDLARSLGAVIRTGEAVTAIARNGAGVSLTTNKGTILAQRAVLATGAWTKDFLGPRAVKQLRVTRQVLHWFATTSPRYAPSDCPVYIWMHGPDPDDLFYGFPSLPGSGSIKVATEQDMIEMHPDNIERDPVPGESEAMFSRHIASRMDAVTDAGARAALCMYTMTPNGDFWIDRHPEIDGVSFISACSGHGFKHSAAIGEAVAQRIVEGVSRIDLSPFALS